jgi:hypothetical protein
MRTGSGSERFRQETGRDAINQNRDELIEARSDLQHE